MTQKYTDEWVITEYIESLERMINATLHQLKQSKDNLKNLKKLVKEGEKNG